MIKFRFHWVVVLGAFLAVYFLGVPLMSKSAAAQIAIRYRVIGESKSSTMERELNLIKGCRPIFVIAGSVRNDPMVILECR